MPDPSTLAGRHRTLCPPMRALLLLLLACTATARAQTAPVQTALAPKSPGPIHAGLEGAELRATLRRDLASTLTLGYGPARDSLYTYEQRASGAVCGVYTAFCITLDPARDASTSAFEQGINAEHTWPQSRGTATEPQRSDLHGLFPARANVNASRGNHPYAEIPDDQATAWYRLADARSATPSGFVDEWSERADGYPGAPYAARFEPREDRAGDIARAVAYIATRYEAAVEASGDRAFLTTMLADLVDWNAQDPPDERETLRSAYIATLQGHANPFLADPTLLARAFTDYGPTGGTGDTTSSPGDLWINEIHYDNASADTGEMIELAGRAGLDLDGWRVVLYNGNGGAPYDDRPLAGTLPDQDRSIGTVLLSYPANGIQNGPDAIALVTPDGSVAQFLSYEGAVVATGGPAAGLTSADIGAQETGTTPAGHSLSLTGTGRAAADFAWTGPTPASPGLLNAGQTISMPTATDAPPADDRPLVVAPNPATDHVTVTLSLGRPAHVRAELYDVLGRRVAVVHDAPASAVSLRFGVDRLANGLYLLRVTATRPGGEASTHSQRLTVAR